MPVQTYTPPTHLDEILFDTPEPERSQALETFLDDYEHVLIRPDHGAGFEARLNSGKVRKFGPRGAKVHRQEAVELLWQFGREGIYTGKHQATGMTPAMLSTLKRDDRETWVTEHGVTFHDNFLTHVEDAEDELEEGPEVPAQPTKKS